MLLIVPFHLAWAGTACYSHADYPAATTHMVIDGDDHHHAHDHVDLFHHDAAVHADDEHSAHCDACHAHCMTFVQSDFVWPNQPEIFTPFSAVMLPRISAVSEPPYRPQWSFLV